MLKIISLLFTALRAFFLTLVAWTLLAYVVIGPEDVVRSQSWFTRGLLIAVVVALAWTVAHILPRPGPKADVEESKKRPPLKLVK